MKEDEIQFIITGDTSIACINNTWTRYRVPGSSFPKSQESHYDPYASLCTRLILAWQCGGKTVLVAVSCIERVTLLSLLIGFVYL